MLNVPCPNCGSRPEGEFRHGGWAGIQRTFTAIDINEEEFCNYLFLRPLPKDNLIHERWVHVAGCMQWFSTLRDLRTNKFSESK